MIIDKTKIANSNIQNSIEQIESENTKKINELFISQIKEEQEAYNKATKNLELKKSKNKYDALWWKILWFLGSRKFIIISLSLHTIRITIHFIPSLWKIDPFPFDKLRFIFYIIMITQSSLIMITQNWKKNSDEERQQNEYIINLKNEVDMKNLHKKIDLVIYDQIQTLLETQKIQFEYLTKIQQKLDIK